MFAWFFISALYLQLLLGYSPLKVGLAFLPANLIMGAFSLGLSAKLVMRFGIKRPLAAGLLLAAVGLVLFARAPVGGSFVGDVLSMILLGCGAGMAFNPMLLAAMSEVAPEESGLASGVVNTAFMMGGARPRRPREPRCLPHRQPARLGALSSGGAQLRLSRRAARGGGVRGRRGVDRRRFPAHRRPGCRNRGAPVLRRPRRVAQAVPVVAGCAVMSKLEATTPPASGELERRLEEHRRELNAYCCRMLGAPCEAQNAAQAAPLGACDLPFRQRKRFFSPAPLPPREPQPLERLRARHLVHEM
jgi:hypothetical protein